MPDYNLTPQELGAIAQGRILSDSADAEERDYRGVPDYEWTAATPADLINGWFDAIEREAAEERRQLVEDANEERCAKYWWMALFACSAMLHVVVAVARWW